MTIRKRSDDKGYKRGAMGIDDKMDDGFSRDHEVDPWSNYGNRQVPDDEDIKGRKVRDNPGHAAYTSDDDAPLRNVDDFQFTARGGSTQRGAAQWGDDIFDDVNANSDIRGDSVNANSGPIKYGVNKKQGK
jgi:hypothetical protein